MNESRFIAGVRFVVDATCAHIEKLPEIDVPLQESSAHLSERKNLFSESRGCKSQAEDVSLRCSQQGVKRSCGQSQKSVRERFCKISFLKRK